MMPGFQSEQEPDLSNFMLTLLAGHLAGLRDRLALDGYYPAADLVADLVDITDDYLMHPPRECRDEEGTIW